jgi:hypothetical protein
MREAFHPLPVDELNKEFRQRGTASAATHQSYSEGLCETWLISEIEESALLKVSSGSIAPSHGKSKKPNEKW